MELQTLNSKRYAQKRLVDFVLCVGDDRSDEDMFALIRDRFSSNNPNPTCAVRPCPNLILLMVQSFGCRLWGVGVGCRV